MVLMDDLFVNICILVTTLFTYSQIFKKWKFISPTGDVHKRITFGIFMGLVSVLLMFYTIHLPDGNFVDLRGLAVIVSVLYGGMVPTVITTLILMIGRIILFKINHTTLIACINALLTSAGCLLICRIKLKRWKQFVLMNLIYLTLTYVNFYLVVKEQNLLLVIYRDYFISLVIGGFATIYHMEYLRYSNELLKRVHADATTDFLTGLNNVRQFDMALNQYIQKAEERNENLSFLLLDIDHFKRVNDTYGHQAGDEVLKQVGEIISSTCRSIDFVSRNGGEEFSVILPACPKEQAAEVSERIRSAVRYHEFILPEGSVIHVTVSIGLSVYLETTKDRNELIKQADDGLYRAKRSGRNKVCCADVSCCLCATSSCSDPCLNCAI